MLKKAGELSIRAELTRLSVCAIQMCVCVHFRCVCVRALQMCVCACASDVCVCACSSVRKTSHTALDSNNPERLICSPRAFGQALYRVLTCEIERECTRWW